MFAPSVDDEKAENMQIITKVLSYLNSKDLQNARLLNFTFNDLIMRNIELFWAKNVLRVCFRPDENQLNNDDWAQLRLHKLIMDNNCPNYHFVNTDLMPPGAVSFFQSSIRHYIKHLEITKCHVTSDVLIHILVCIGKQLEHLEMGDFSKFQTTQSSIKIQSSPKLYLPSLVTLILSDQNSGPELPHSLLQAILLGSFKLEKICLHQWGAGTCQKFTKLLGSVGSNKLQNTHYLEIACTTSGENSTPSRHYGFLKQLARICMPTLRKLSIRFDSDLCSTLEGSIEHQLLVETMTNSVANMIEGATATLEWIELVNCPISNNVFRAGINSLQNLRHINTRGSFVSRLDDDANPVYEYSIINKKVRRRERRSITKANIDDTNMPSDSENIRHISDTMTRVEVYKLMCAVFLCVAVIHCSIQWILGSYIGNKLEMLIYAVIVFLIFKSTEISDIWATSL